ncbi:hypothetical protein ATB98_12290 [Sinorhizobium saheli]|uniref:Uncharacterized protein n=1 Tax=Sinorhizobium saheli TaxID=36856 RepID=A0A178YR86_SINSA|nr:hypothetical protein ATB98_12290 [Sinorhizobium saheli]
MLYLKANEWLKDPEISRRDYTAIEKLSAVHLADLFEALFHHTESELAFTAARPTPVLETGMVSHNFMRLEGDSSKVVFEIEQQTVGQGEHKLTFERWDHAANLFHLRDGRKLS